MHEILNQLTRLDDNIKTRLNDAYHAAVRRIGEVEFKYIDEKIKNKLFVTGHSRLPWVQDLSHQFEKLYKIFDQETHGGRRLQPSTINLMGAALFYFINLYDIIPDMMPDCGYIDDLFILLACLNAIKGDDYTVACKDFNDLLN